MNRSNNFAGALILVAMVMALPQLAYANDSGSAGTYSVVVNHEEQYSFWPTGKAIPKGWKATNFTGSKAAALNHIGKVWVAVGSVSARKKMAVGLHQKLRRK